MKKKTKIGAVLCCSTALVSILGGYFLTKNIGLTLWGDPSVNNQDIEPTAELETSQTVENMSVMLLNKSTNPDGSISYTYTFTITPVTATRKDISGNLFFIDNSSGIENFLSFTIDNANGTFTITKKADFSKKAKLVLTCNADPNVKATISLECRQYFKGFSNVSEKAYSQLLTGENSLVVDNIISDGATEINASNFSTVYTLSTRTAYRIEGMQATLTGYLTGDSIDAMSDSGLTIDNNYAISAVDLTEDFSLQNLYDCVYADSALMPGTNAKTFSQRELFGIGYDLAITYNVSSTIKTYTAHLVVVADTDNLNFGLPTKLSVESTTVKFEDVKTSVRFIFTDSNDNVTYIDGETSSGTGWSSTYESSFYNGYINVEITRMLDGVAISDPMVVYSLNDGKGYYTGNQYTNIFIVYNPGGYESVKWISVHTKFNDNLYAVTNFASSSW